VDVRLSVRPGRECMVVEVAGDLDMATAPQLREGLQRVLDAGTRNVVVDLAGVGFMDSSGLGALVVMFNAARERGGRLCLAATQRRYAPFSLSRQWIRRSRSTTRCSRPRPTCHPPWPERASAR